MKGFSCFLILCLFLIVGCNSKKNTYQVVIPSPDFKIQMYFSLYNGKPFYLVYYDNQKLIDWSQLGFINESGQEYNQDLKFIEEENDNTKIQYDDELEVIFGNSGFNSLKAKLQSGVSGEILYSIHFRVYNSGIVFRYQMDKSLPKQNVINWVEGTEFDLASENINWTISTDDETFENPEPGLPLVVDSDIGIQITVDEIISMEYPQINFVKRNDSGNEYISSFLEDTKSVKLKAGEKSSWRIISFSKQN